MVNLTRIYTRGGDTGKTSLGTGQRVAKFSPRIAAYGTVEEANAALGLTRLQLEAGEVDRMLERVQNDLFDVGADLCTPEQSNPKHTPLRVTPSQVEWLEQEIDRLNENLEPLKSFILPGGTPVAANLHMARTITRRAEREASHLASEEELNAEAVRYLNRVSDLLFVLSRYVNDNGAGDVLWKPGANR